MHLIERNRLLNELNKNIHELKPEDLFFEGVKNGLETAVAIIKTQQWH